MHDISNVFAEIHDIIIQNAYIKIIFSNPISKNCEFSKVIMEQKKNAGELYYQFSIFFGVQVKHENHKQAFAYEKFQYFAPLYKQCDIITEKKSLKILRSKSGNTKITGQTKNKKAMEPKEHNISKNYILNTGESAVWLYRLGITNKEGVVLSDKQKKYRQINKFLEIVDSIEPEIPDDAIIIDVGCGKAYLTFALYYYLKRIKNKNVYLTGIDIKKSVINDCSKLSQELGFDGLSFVCGKIEDYIPNNKTADMVVCLHACDTATDYAIALAVTAKAKIILSAPCCQHELFAQIDNNLLKPLLKHGILKERFSALLTDSVRALLLEAYGYKCTVMEFIETDSTPKNIMIRAVKKDTVYMKNEEAFEQYKALAETFRIDPALYRLLNEWNGDNNG